MVNQVDTMKKHLLSFILLLSVLPLAAQNITIGPGIYASTVFGPMTTITTPDVWNRHAYIYNSGNLTGLVHGDTINSMAFNVLTTAKNLGSPNFKIYVGTTSKFDFGAGRMSWSNEIAGLTLAYDGNPFTVLDSLPGFHTFKFTTPVKFDTTGGKVHLEVLVEYYQDVACDNTIFWYYDDITSATGYNNNQCKFITGSGTIFTDSTNSSSSGKPMLRVNFPRYNTDVNVQLMYTLGKIPVPLGNPDTVKALVTNSGKRDLVNHKVYIRSQGVNNLFDSTYIDIKSFETRTIKLPELILSNLGIDTLTVASEPDDNNTNNTKTWRRLANENVYSYSNIDQGSAGGIGFNGATGDFVAKFQCKDSNYINQITVNFSGGGRPFRIGIWKADGPDRTPGTLLWQSDSLISANGAYIVPVSPKIVIKGEFFVGVRQLETNNVAFSYQPEEPVRPGHFYYTSPVGSTFWTDFAPLSPFRFMIEPRLQTANDVAAVAIVSPNGFIEYNPTAILAPKARIVNYGRFDQATPFDIVCNIYHNNTLFYTSTIQDTLSSDLSRVVTFDSTFNPSFLGDYKVEVFTRLGIDKVLDNDTVRATFPVDRRNDVGPNLVFSPSSGDIFEQGIDTVYATVQIQNYGAGDQNTPFQIVCRILSDTGKVLFTDIKTATITAKNSTIVTFDGYPVGTTGNVRMEIFTRLGTDSYINNDTALLDLIFIKTNDVAIVSIDAPPADINYAVPTEVTPGITIESQGTIVASSPVKTYCSIIRNNEVVYLDSQEVNVTITAVPVTYAPYTPELPGRYQVLARIVADVDQVIVNDTMTRIFTVGKARDISVDTILRPLHSEILSLNGPTIAPRMVMTNKGFTNETTVFRAYCEIWNGGNLAYSSSRMDTLTSGLSREVRFDSSFNTIVAGDYEIKVFTALGADMDRTNDTLVYPFRVMKEHDMMAVSIDRPLAKVQLSSGLLAPKATIKNDSRNDETNVQATLTISHNSVNVYTSTVTVAVNTGETIQVTFDSTFNPEPAGLYRAKVVLTVTGDQLHANDSLGKPFLVIVDNDITPFIVIQPFPGGQVPKLPNLIAPRAGFRNDGRLDQSTAFPVTLKIFNSSNTEIYTSTKTLALDSSEEKLVAFDSTFNADAAGLGNYRVLVYSNLGNDEMRINDTLRTEFEIVEPLNVKPVWGQSLRAYPNPMQGILHIDGLPANQIIQARLMSIHGQVIIQQQLNGPATSIVLPPMAAGIYLLELQSPERCCTYQTEQRAVKVPLIIK